MCEAKIILKDLSLKGMCMASARTKLAIRELGRQMSRFTSRNVDSGYSRLPPQPTARVNPSFPGDISTKSLLPAHGNIFSSILLGKAFSINL